MAENEERKTVKREAAEVKTAEVKAEVKAETQEPKADAVKICRHCGMPA